MKTTKLKCSYCGKEIEKPTKEVNRQIRKGRNDFFCDLTCGANQNNLKRGFQLFEEEEKICPQCGKLFITEIEHRKNRGTQVCCSKKCANKYFMNEERKQNLHIDWTPEKRKEHSDKIKKLQQDPAYQAKMAKHFKENTHFTSKNEMIIRDYFISNFPNDGWTFGGTLKHNELLLVRDLYSSILKICFEYDGDQHFKDIHGQLELKREKDCALEEWCILNEYRLIRIDENIYKSDPVYWLHQLVCEIYNGVESIVKFGFRY